MGRESDLSRHVPPVAARCLYSSLCGDSYSADGLYGGKLDLHIGSMCLRTHTPFMAFLSCGHPAVSELQLLGCQSVWMDSCAFACSGYRRLVILMLHIADPWVLDRDLCTSCKRCSYSGEKHFRKPVFMPSRNVAMAMSSVFRNTLLMSTTRDASLGKGL